MVLLNRFDSPLAARQVRRPLEALRRILQPTGLYQEGGAVDISGEAYHAHEEATEWCLTT
jgi:hypothetical protein